MSQDQYRYTKYQTYNPVVIHLINGFYHKIGQIMQGLTYKNLLDAGCGDSEALIRLSNLLPDDTVGFDLNEEQIRRSRIRLPTTSFEKQDIYNLSYPDNSFEMVICFEVMEHLEKPLDALEELARVSSKYLLLSVPHEPYFMLGNLLRGKNISRLGNDIEHINHWGKRKFCNFLTNKVEVKSIEKSFPWLIALCEKNKA